ncbi:MAG: PIN domain-containing protein [Deltaproteobacteria bacterium]|nr:PIN domain-containing protein [Deltaproteobacteria bacterium]
MSNFTVVFDACVLVPMHLRSLLMWMASSELFRAKWSADIHDEWTRNVVKIRKKKGASDGELAALATDIQATRKDMDQAVRDALVTGYEELAKTLTETSEEDRHVVAAAIVGSAELIVTYNLKDFPKAELSKFNLEAIHPDDFLSDQADLDPDKCLALVKKDRTHFKKPPISVDDYIAILKKLDLGKFATFLEANKAKI